MLRRRRIEVGAQQRRAVGIGAAQAEIHAAARRRLPSSAPRGRAHRFERADEGAVRVAACAARYGPCRYACACRRRWATPCRPTRSEPGKQLSAPGGDSRSILPSAMTMSAATSPSASGSPAKTVGEHGGQRRVLQRRSVGASGTAAKPVVAHGSVLPPDGALVPLPQDEMRDQAGGAEDHDAGKPRAAPGPRRGAEC